jgi:hypothetical protein
MTTRRTAIRHDQRAGRITPQITAIYKRITELEKIGGLEDKAYTLKAELKRALGRREPWLVSVVDTRDLDEPPSWVHDGRTKDDWLLAIQIRQALDAAIEEK